MVTITYNPKSDPKITTDANAAYIVQCDGKLQLAIIDAAADSVCLITLTDNAYDVKGTVRFCYYKDFIYQYEVISKVALTLTPEA